MAKNNIIYRDASTLLPKESVVGNEVIPVSDLEYITPKMMFDEMSGGIGGSQINIHTRKVSAAGGFVLQTIIEGVSNDDLVKLSDSSKYRLCLVRHRKGGKAGRNWHITALPYFRAARTGVPVNPKSHNISEQHAWWPVTGRIVPWFRGTSIFDVLPFGISEVQKRFKNSRNLKMLDGVALFQYTGRGGEGWTRISNISFVESYLCCLNSPGKQPYVIVNVKF